MSSRLMDIFRASGDAHLGQTLVRLAGLAESAHRAQTAGNWMEETQAGSGAEGFGTQAVIQTVRREAASGTVLGHTEVVR